MGRAQRVFCFGLGLDFDPRILKSGLIDLKKANSEIGLGLSPKDENM